MNEALNVWRAIAEEAECVVERGIKKLVLTEEMCVRLGTAIEAAASAPAVADAAINPEDVGLPPYPKDHVVGPCVCGSWPGGECLKCPVIPGSPAVIADTAGAKPVAWKWNQGGILYREDAPDEHNAWKWTPLFDTHAIDAAGASDFDKQVAKLTFLLRTELKKLDDETLAQLDLVERSLERRRIDAAPCSPPFTTDVPQCCGDPETCNDPRAPAIHAKGASEARDIALSELYDMVYEECYFMDFRKRVIELLAQGVLK